MPKKHFPRAVDRNRIKRLMREIVRQAKPGFLDNLRTKQKNLVLLLSYQGKTIPTLAELQPKINTLLEHLTSDKR